MHWPNRVLWHFESCSCIPHFPTNWTTSVAYPLWLHCCLDHDNTSVCESTCFTSRASLVLLPKMRAFASTAFLFPTTILTVDRESLLRCQLASVSDLGSLLRNHKFLIYWRWVSHPPSHGSEQYKMTSPPERPKRAARCKWRHCEGKSKGRVTKPLSTRWCGGANCFCNFCHI